MAEVLNTAELDKCLYQRRRDWRHCYAVIEQIALVLAGAYVVAGALLSSIPAHRLPGGVPIGTQSLLLMLGFGALYLVCSQQRALMAEPDSVGDIPAQVVRTVIHRHARRIAYLWLSLLLFLPLLVDLGRFAFHNGQ